jgi:hypothetical protein
VPSPRYHVLTVYPAPELLDPAVGKHTVTPAQLEMILAARGDDEADPPGGPDPDPAAPPDNGWELEFTQLIEVPLGGGAKTTVVAACMVFLKEREL